MNMKAGILNGAARFGGAWLGLGLIAVGAVSSRAIVFNSTADPSFNTSTPGGAYADSGWQYAGYWGGVSGTPISPNAFLTATHVGGNVGDTFLYGGLSYTTTAVHNNGDLAVWEVSQTFSTYAPLMTLKPAINAEVVVIGRGTQRGAEVSVDGQIKGWEWGASDGVLRWGVNNISANSGSFLRFNLDAGGGVNEAFLTGGDSGGPMFAMEDGVWKLAGIHYGVDGPYGYTANGATFNAALSDRGGLYRNGVPFADNVADNPGPAYSTSIAPSLPWITSVAAVPVPEPGTVALMLLGGGWLGWTTLRRRRG